MGFIHEDLKDLLVFLEMNKGNLFLAIDALEKTYN